jgi:predicted membrane channel-forming protein YqfA (hemolysin III family)
MINWDTFLYGLISLALGLTGLLIKSKIDKGQKYFKMLIGTYALLVCGVIFIILSFLPD